eukprot:CAMPEP_0115166904 /NCGR_PEP_ID=MMETSP0227-20121206/74368_1 /TAXON_ID=89957 /ORGANISM="Polarella glacialis, Strain CCMP 1383" /LENGTH=762 /DNA_ID=CAMNT_0002579461 /DNA_START=75 /DNA_END=2365 /DNA_ORIENTATION=+
MDRSDNYGGANVTPELRALLKQRLRIVEGPGRAGTAPPGGRSTQTGFASAPVRLQAHRQPAPTNVGITGGGRSATNAVYGLRAVPPSNRFISVFDDRSYERPAEKIKNLNLRNHQLSVEVKKMKDRLLEEEGGSLMTDERERLIHEADGLLAESERVRACNRELQLEKDRLKKVASELTTAGVENAEVREALRRVPDEYRGGQSAELSAMQVELDALRAQNLQLNAGLARCKGASVVEGEKLRAERAELKEALAAKDLDVGAGKQKEHEEELRKVKAELQEMRAERDNLRGASQAAPAPIIGNCSESRLRSVMTSQTATAAQLRQAIGGAEALLDEARRELASKQLRERRAAYEQLHVALDKADEDLLAAKGARKAEVDAVDILKGEAKLLELQSISPEEKAARARREEETRRKKEAFIMVKKDDAEALDALLAELAESVRWQDWRDYARCARDLRAGRAQKVLADREGPKDEPNRLASGIFSIFRRNSSPESVKSRSNSFEEDVATASAPSSPAKPPSPAHAQKAATQAAETSAATGVGEASLEAPAAVGATRKGTASQSLTQAKGIGDEDPAEPPDSLPPDEEEKLKAQALRAVVQDDCASLAEVMLQAHSTIWSRWENKAGKDLLTLAQERGSSSAYSVLAKALGMVKEMKRDTYEERETVWVFVNGDVQPRRATVLEDTPEDAEDVLVEFWDGDSPPDGSSAASSARCGLEFCRAHLQSFIGCVLDALCHVRARMCKGITRGPHRTAVHFPEQLIAVM